MHFRIGSIRFRTWLEGQESLHARFPQVDFDIEETGTEIIVKKVVVAPESRGQGIGTAFMREVIAHGIKENKPVFLSPSNEYGGSSRKLRKWYQSLGFKENPRYRRDNYYSMVRWPDKFSDSVRQK